MDAVLTKELPITFYQVDHNSALKPSVLLNYFQGLATDSADSLGFGYDVIMEKKVCWFLIKYHIEFKKYPSNVKSLTFKTEPRGVDKLMALRDFEVLENGESIVKATSSWLLVDMDTRNLVSIKEVLPSMFPHEKREGDLKFEKIKLPENFNNKIEFRVRYDDLDINQHVNNANYIVWALEALPFEFRSNHGIKSLDMYFKKEALYNETIVSQCLLDETNLTSTHSITNKETGEELCLVMAKYF